jgi:type IV secretion system protein TrbL
VKILVLAVIIGIGSTIFGQFTGGFNNPPTINDALTLILASLAMLALSIFGPGIANGLIAGGPQLGAGAAVGTGLAVAGIGAAGAGLAAGGLGAAGGLIGGTARGAASVAGGASAAFRVNGRAGVAEAAAAAVSSPLRRAASSLQDSFAGGASASTGAASPAASAQGTPSAPPTWMSRATRSPIVSRAASVADHAIRSGDRPIGGASVDLSEGE